MVAAVTATTVAVQENLEIQRAALKPQEQSPHHQISELHDDYLITGEGKKGITRLKIKLLGRLLEKKRWQLHNKWHPTIDPTINPTHL